MMVTMTGLRAECMHDWCSHEDRVHRRLSRAPPLDVATRRIRLHVLNCMSDAQSGRGRRVVRGGEGESRHEREARSGERQRDGAVGERGGCGQTASRLGTASKSESIRGREGEGGRRGRKVAAGRGEGRGIWAVDLDMRVCACSAVLRALVACAPLVHERRASDLSWTSRTHAMPVAGVRSRWQRALMTDRPG